MADQSSALLASLDRALANCDARAAYLSQEQQRLARYRRQVLARRAAVLAEAQAAALAAARDRALAAARTWSRPAPPPVVAPASALAPVAEPAPAPAVDPVPVDPPVDPPPVQPETSLVSVQNVLLAVGGVLLGVAAITFSVVAWTTFGSGGRALILVGGTAIALAVPVLLARRELAATAETISGVALLLVALDGYTVWSLGLFGVDRAVSGYGFAGLVLLATSVAAGGYRAVTRLTVPRFVAVVAAQPVLPLLALGALGVGADDTAGTHQLDLARLTAGLAGSAVLSCAVAAQNLVVAVRLARRTDSPLALRVLAWALHGSALGAGWVLAATALATGPAPVPVLGAAGALLLCAVVGIASAVPAGRRGLRDLAAGAATLAVVADAFRVGVLAWPDGALAGSAGAVALAAAGIRMLPGNWRRGATAAGAALTGVLATVVGLWALGVAARAVDAAFPAWRSAGPATAVQSWQLPVAVVLVTVAAALLVPERMRGYPVLAGLVLTTVAGPAALPLPWWVRPGAAALVAVGLGLAGLVDRRGYLRVSVAAGLAGYAGVTALPRASVSAAVLAVLVLGCAGLAAMGYPLRRTVVADASVGGGLALAPMLVAAVLAATGVAVAPLAAVTAVVAALCLAAATAVATMDRPGAAVVAAGGGLVTALTLLDANPGPALALLVASSVLCAAAAHPAVRAVAPAAVTVALVAAVVRLVALPAPGLALLVAAGLASAIGLAAGWRRSPGVAAGAFVCGAAAGAVAGVLALRAAVLAVLAACAPHPWAAHLVDAPGGAGRSLPFALLLLAAGAWALPERYREPAALATATVALLGAPASFGLPWWAPAAVSAATGAALALRAVRATEAGTGTAVLAALAGAHATGAALGRPGSTALVLGATVLTCAAVGALGHAAPRGRHTERVADAAIGAGLAALPGAVASGAAAAGLPTPAVVAIALAAAGTALTVASVVRLARGTGEPALGAAAGAVLTGTVVWGTGAASLADHVAIGFLVLAAALRVLPRRRAAGGAGGATLALIVSLSRLGTVLVPGFGLLTVALVILLVAVAVSLLAPAWRYGPAGAVGLACAVVGWLLAALASVHAGQLLVASLPAWHADVNRWPRLGAATLGWQPPFALVLLAAAVLVLARSPVVRGWSAERARDAAAAALLPAVVEAPLALGLPWWAPAAVAGTAAFGCAVATAGAATHRAGVRTAVAGGLLGLFAVLASLARPGATAAVLAGVVACGGLVAAARRVHPVVGGAAVAGSLAALPGAVAAGGVALGLPAGTALRGALAAAGVAFAVAGWLRPARLTGAPVLGATAGATAIVLATVPAGEPTGLYAALVAVGAATSRSRAGRRASWVPLGIALLAVAPGIAWALLTPFPWIRYGWPGTGWDPAVLALAGLALTVAGTGRWARITVALAIVVAPYAWGAPRLAGAAAALAVAGFTALWAARGRTATVATTVLCGLSGGAGLAGCFTDRTATYAGLANTCAVGLAVAAVGRRTGARVAGWLAAGGAAVALSFAVGLRPAHTAAGVVAVAVLLLLAAAVLPRRQRVEAVTVEGLSCSAALLAALTVVDDLRAVAVLLVGYGAALGLSALRDGRRAFAPVAAGCELVAWWLLLFAADVGVVEAYTLPVALLAVAGGLYELRRRPYLNSWLAYGPALAATFLPSLALLFTGVEEPARRLLVGAGGFAALVLGATRRRQAPVVSGATVLAISAGYELVRYWDALPRWLPLGVGGLVLVVLGATYERRRRDMNRLREMVAQLR
jgi:hypothetical protein